MRDGNRGLMLSGATRNEASKWILRFTTLRLLKRMLYELKLKKHPNITLLSHM